METILSRLDLQFGSFPEIVIFLAGGRLLYTNEAGEIFVKTYGVSEDFLFALAEHPGTATEIALGEDTFHVTVSPLEKGDLLIFRPAEKPIREGNHPFSSAVYRMRDCLSNFTAVQWKMQRVLAQNDLAERFQQELANQSRLVMQMLRLTKQAELTQELNDKEFPREEGFDLAQVCQGMADETAELADLAGVRFTYRANVDHLPFKASKSLLTQMLLALISNSIRAAGREGTVEMKLTAEHGRCVISLRDSGAGIAPDRMATLFSGEVTEEVPRPGEGAGLGLYNARRIASLHGGFLIAQSGQEGGATLVASLPIATPESVPARNNPGYDNLGGYSPILIELSDVLPWQAYVREPD